MLPSFRSVLLLTVASLVGVPAFGAPSIAMPTVNPASLTVGLSSLVTASCQITTAPTDPTLLPGGVDLARLTATGTAVSTLGVMHDDGLNGDAQAGDGIYTLQFTTNESAAGAFELQCTAAFKGLLQRVKSPAATVTVSAGPGTIGLPTVSPASIAYAAPTSVTITASVTGANPDSGSVMLQRLDSSGRVLAILGGLHDDGLDGDAVPADGIFTLVTTFTEFAVGSVSLRVSATFSGAVSHVFSPITSLTVTGTPPPTVTISAPTNLSYLSLSPTTVNGTVSDPQATVVINSIPVAVANGTFSASIPLAEGPNILTATATSASGSVGTASIQVNLDTTPPHVTITSPSDQFVTSAANFSIAGNVNDIVVGTVNAQQVQVTVNGVAAQVGNRTFLAPNIPLSLGPNVIHAVAVDQAGNSATTQITVTRQAPQPGQIQVVSGNNQTGTIGGVLAAPLVVTLTNSTGNPAANKPVIFSVTQNNGMLVANGAAPAASVLVNTNAQGQAIANWTLGMRAGAGSDGVQAYSVGFGGTAVFTATANQGTPGMIVVDSGNNQTGAVNQQLPKPLIAVVIDAGHNRLAGVPVTFTVLQGGGSISGQASVTVTTDSDGRAAVTPTLGFQEGNANNLITATFATNTGFPASFSASGLGPGDPANTVISGLVLDNSNQPVPGVTVRALLTNALTSSAASTQTAATATSDATGHFSISPAPVGYVKLLVDGSTASTAGTFPSLEYDMVTVAGNINTVNQPVYLLPIKTNNQLCVTATTGGGTLTIPEAPGFSLTFGPGQVTFPGGSKTGCVSVTSVHPDKVPMVPGFGQQPRFIVTIQPSGALFNPPAPITLPNVDGLKAREVTEMYSYDHDISSFVAIGTGTVSDDGQVVRSNVGVGVLKAGWHCGGDPSANGTVADCPPCSFCNGNSCQPDPSQTNQPCNGTFNNCFLPGSGTCGNLGQCVGGSSQPDGTSCNSGGSVLAVCLGGQCTGSNTQCPASCDDGDPCTIDQCVNGSCAHLPDPQCNFCSSQSDGTSCGLCQTGGSCQGGQCVGGTQSPAGASCGECMTGGTCGAGGECLNAVPAPDGTSCSDGGTCIAGVCTDGCQPRIMATTSVPVEVSELPSNVRTHLNITSDLGVCPLGPISMLTGDIRYSTSISLGSCSSPTQNCTFDNLQLDSSQLAPGLSLADPSGNPTNSIIVEPGASPGDGGLIVLRKSDTGQTVNTRRIQLESAGQVIVQAGVDQGNASGILIWPSDDNESYVNACVQPQYPTLTAIPQAVCVIYGHIGDQRTVKGKWLQIPSKDGSGSAQTKTCMATIPESGTTSCTMTFELTDKPPIITPTLDPATPLPTYDDMSRPWHKAPVSVDLICSDPDDASSDLVCPNMYLFAAEGAGQTVPPTVFAVDPNGLHSAPITGFEVNIDTHAPNVPFSVSPMEAQTTYVSSNVVLTVTATDALSGVSQSLSQISVDGAPTFGLLSPITLTLDGDHLVSFFAVDYAANVSATQTIHLKIDKTPPTISITSPVSGTSVATLSAVITGTLADSGSGIDPSTVRCNNGALLSNATVTGNTFSCTVALFGGNNPITAQASDFAHNLGVSQPIFLNYSPLLIP